MNALGIIPARYESTRFPGKPLVDINGKSMIQRVYEQAVKAKLLTHVIVATDDHRIVEAVNQFGGTVMMTNTNHPSGTDRCNEVLEKRIREGHLIDVVVNIQGDEPYISPQQIDKVCDGFSDPGTKISTLVKKIESAEELFSNSVNKVILDNKKNAIYFSRTPIPFQSTVKKEEWHRTFRYFKHIGIYAYRAETLRSIAALRPSLLEKAESLEQLRWIENGFSIKAEETHEESFAVDTPEDISKFTNMS